MAKKWIQDANLKEGAFTKKAKRSEEHTSELQSPE